MKVRIVMQDRLPLRAELAFALLIVSNRRGKGVYGLRYDRIGSAVGRSQNSDGWRSVVY